jgi:uncharacterized protein YkwD
MVELLIMINMVRVSPLKISHTLSSIADKRATYLCDHEFSHAGWRSYPSKFSYRGENLAKDYGTIKEAHEALMLSASHKANILNKNYRYVGLAYKCGILVEEFGGYSY